ncbi:MAG: hypothetical protein JWP87_2522 [Labilithrix sp.]|jgi:hypothetical protein|nr:hypothetical protein [Labilithrix sp.]
MTTRTTSNLTLAVQPAALTGFALALAAAFAVFFSPADVLLYAAFLPVPLILLWVARDVQAPIDRIEAVDAKRHAG